VPEPTISDWTINQLTRFVTQLVTDHETAGSPNRRFDEVEVTRKLKVTDELGFSGATQTTIGAAGAASNTPVSPELYVKVLDPKGIVRLIPLYLSS
jgi:hypothetical protein